MDVDDYQPGQLTEGWRWTLALGWALTIPALLTLADAANSFGKPPWWMSSTATVTWWSPIPFLVLVVVTSLIGMNWRRWPLASAAGVLLLGVSAAVDASRSPSVAIGEAALAGAALATTLAALAGRVRRAH
ncbi:MAG: hypothetical protein RL219_547 [Actinomycetota bacterium]|jgi:hypothetical protein